MDPQRQYQQRQQLQQLVEQLQIATERYQHPPLQTCAEADRLGLVRSGLRTKNLFLRSDNGKRHFLLATLSEQQVDLKALAKTLGLRRLGFASPERLWHYLGLEPGQVSLLALGHPAANQVEVLIDQQLWTGASVQCHPLDNCQTWCVPQQGLVQLFDHWQVRWQLLPVPALSNDIRAC
ncbi:YbaK/EbsC family protein [Ferrimonas senticii]|uniref:YbaK/EbsC family protein n=1 Tax=Ferrimonas senticii TaxID=394566 RepID=UPI0003F9E57A|nr:YbaK/EbsC family protein [Ferrimonas senticii]